MDHYCQKVEGYNSASTFIVSKYRYGIIIHEIPLQSMFSFEISDGRCSMLFWDQTLFTSTLLSFIVCDECHRGANTTIFDQKIYYNLAKTIVFWPLPVCGSSILYFQITTKYHKNHLQKTAYQNLIWFSIKMEIYTLMHQLSFPASKEMGFSPTPGNPVKNMLFPQKQRW